MATRLREGGEGERRLFPHSSPIEARAWDGRWRALTDDSNPPVPA
jgi:hypothetical protein